MKYTKLPPDDEVFPSSMLIPCSVDFIFIGP